MNRRQAIGCSRPQASSLSQMSEDLYRPGLEGIVAGETAVSTIAGGLSYRGYGIEDLAAHARFDEVAYLLLHGELPKVDELSAFRHRLVHYAAVPHQVIDMLRIIPPHVPLMDAMRTG